MNEKTTSELQNVSAGPQSTFDIVEKVTKTSVLVLAACYSVGMLVSNQYLIALGSSDFSSVRPKYVLTGSWVLLMILVSSLPVLLPTAAKRYGKRWFLLAFLGLLFSASSGIGLLILLQFDFRWMNEQGAVVGSFAFMISMACFCAFFTQMAVRRLRLIVEPRARLLGLVVTIVILCAFLGSVTHSIAEHIYNHIPEALGGGKAVLARVILNDKGAEFWKQAGVIQGEDAVAATLSSRSVTILYQDDKVMIIEVADQRGIPANDSIKTMILNKNLIDAIVIAGRPIRH